MIRIADTYHLARIVDSSGEAGIPSNLSTEVSRRDAVPNSGVRFTVVSESPIPGYLSRIVNSIGETVPLKLNPQVCQRVPIPDSGVNGSVS